MSREKTPLWLARDCKSEIKSYLEAHGAELTYRERARLDSDGRRHAKFAGVVTAALGFGVSSIYFRERRADSLGTKVMSGVNATGLGIGTLALAGGALGYALVPNDCCRYDFGASALLIIGGGAVLGAFTGAILGPTLVRRYAERHRTVYYAGTAIVVASPTIYISMNW